MEFPPELDALISKSTTPRSDGRCNDALRDITFEVDVAPNAAGSVRVSFGDTQVICAASLEKKVPAWMKAQGVLGGWLTAEYSLLPYSTLDRKPRASAQGKLDGRTVEIQRLIGRALRAVVDLKKLPGWTLWVDCDVIQADGGTRTAAITGAYVAAYLACERRYLKKELAENPFKEAIAAVSVGIYKGQVLLDLNYKEDKEATVDCNIVMTASGQFVEVQSSGEEAVFSEAQLTQMLSLAKKGIDTLLDHQKAALEKVL